MSRKKKQQGFSIKFWKTETTLDDILFIGMVICMFVLAWLFFFYQSPEEVCDGLCYKTADSRMNYIQEDHVNWCVCRDGTEIQATSAG